MKRTRIIPIILFLALAANGHAQLIKLWDFKDGILSQESDFTADNSKWNDDTSNSRFDNTANYCPQNEELMVNGQKVAMTDGLKFNITANAQRIRLTYKNDKSNSVLLNGKNQSVIIPDLKKGQIVEVDCRTGNGTVARTFTFTNLKKYSDSDYSASKLRVVNRGTVIADGDVTLTTAADASNGGGMHIYSIAVFELEPINSHVWDFTKISDADLTALATDAGDGGAGKWHTDNDKDNTRYSTTDSYAITTAEALQANSANLEFTSGLKFTFAASNNKVSIYPNNVQGGLQLRGGDISLIIPNCKKGTRIFMPFRSGSQGTERGFTSTNFTLDEGSSLTTLYFGYVTGVATEDGDVVFKTSSGTNVRWLAVSPPSVSITETGYATYSNDKDIDLSLGDTHLKAYYVNSKTANSVTLTETTKFAGNEGVILKGTPNSPFFLYEALEDISTNETNFLRPNLTATTLSATTGGNTNYILVPDGAGGVMFAPSSGSGTLAANRAYLQLPTPADPAREYVLSFNDDELTGIKAVKSSKEKGADVCYDLSGRRVAQPTKGLYIMNGKKYIVK